MDLSHDFATHHLDFIQDVRYDYYGERLATCSSDHSIKIWERDQEGSWQCTGSIVGNCGAISRVEWAHPEFGNVIAACSSDHNVIVFEETGKYNMEYRRTYGGGVLMRSIESAETGKRIWSERTRLVDSSGELTDIKFSPRQHGLLLAAASEDGAVRVYEAVDIMELSVWPLKDEFVADPDGCNCLSWNKSPFDPPQIVVGTKTSVKIFEYFEQHRRWSCTVDVCTFTSPVYDVDWAPNMGRSFHLIACGTHERRLCIFKIQRDADGTSTSTQIASLTDQNAEIWRVAWNPTGTVLASTGDNGSVYLWKRDLEGIWRCTVEVAGSQHDQPDVHHDKHGETTIDSTGGAVADEDEGLQMDTASA